MAMAAGVRMRIENRLVDSIRFNVLERESTTNLEMLFVCTCSHVIAFDMVELHQEIILLLLCEDSFGQAVQDIVFLLNSGS